jgi:hypothetical protein
LSDSLVHPERSLASSNQFPPYKSRNLCIFSLALAVLNPPHNHAHTPLAQE